MESVREIEAAIRALSAQEREKLVNDLPQLFPELDGDAAWEKIIRDDQPRPAFSKLIDEIEGKLGEDKDAFSKIRPDDFE